MLNSDPLPTDDELHAEFDAKCPPTVAGVVRSVLATRLYLIGARVHGGACISPLRCDLSRVVYGWSAIVHRCTVEHIDRVLAVHEERERRLRAWYPDAPAGTVITPT